RLHEHELAGAKSAIVSGAQARRRGHVHHDWPDCVCCSAQYSDIAHDDGHGKDQRHRGADVNGHAKSTDSAHFCLSGAADWGSWNRDWVDRWLLAVLGWRALSLDFAFGRGLFHRLRSFCPENRAWGDRCWHSNCSISAGDGVSVMVGGEDFACRGAEIRMNGDKQ